MKSALCLLSGKSCAGLIEMFIRQIYREGKEEGGQAAPQSGRAGTDQAGPSRGSGKGEGQLEQVKRACQGPSCDLWEGKLKEGAQQLLISWDSGWVEDLA